MDISLGKPVHDGQTVVVDHTVREFRVVIRSMNNVGPDTIKNLIQTKFEVVKCEVVNETSYVYPV